MRKFIIMVVEVDDPDFNAEEELEDASDTVEEVEERWLNDVEDGLSSADMNNGMTDVMSNYYRSGAEVEILSVLPLDFTGRRLPRFRVSSWGGLTELKS